jgi:hypothetical protein
MMILRLKSRLASGLIIATVALAGTSAASAADTPTAGRDANAKADAPAATTTPSGAPSTGQGGGDVNMAPRGNDAAATPHTTPSAAGAGDSQVKRIFDQLDLNHDGMLSLDEFSRATFEQPK